VWVSLVVSLLIVGCTSSAARTTPQSKPTEVTKPSAPLPASATADLQPTIEAAVRATSQAASVVEPTTVPSPTVPSRVVVANTEGLGVYLRRAPGSEERIKAWPEGTEFVSFVEEQRVGTATWRKVRDPDGNEGWVNAEYLVPPERYVARPVSTATSVPTVVPTAARTTAPTAMPKPAATSTPAQARPLPAPAPAPAPPPAVACCRRCTTGKACGNSCIAAHLTCRVGAGCACNAYAPGVMPAEEVSRLLESLDEADVIGEPCMTDQEMVV
jgi:SH3-like domain-containing protein